MSGPTFKATIKVGVFISHDFRVYEWPSCAKPSEIEEIDPKMVFDVTCDLVLGNITGYKCKADGFGNRGPSNLKHGYGNGSIFVRNLEDLEILPSEDRVLKLYCISLNDMLLYNFTGAVVAAYSEEEALLVEPLLFPESEKDPKWTNWNDYSDKILESFKHDEGNDNNLSVLLLGNAADYIKPGLVMASMYA
jgi:hypothetical protein